LPFTARSMRLGCSTTAPTSACTSHDPLQCVRRTTLLPTPNLVMPWQWRSSHWTRCLRSAMTHWGTWPLGVGEGRGWLTRGAGQRDGGVRGRRGIDAAALTSLGASSSIACCKRAWRGVHAVTARVGRWIRGHVTRHECFKPCLADSPAPLSGPFMHTRTHPPTHHPMNTNTLPPQATSRPSACAPPRRRPAPAATAPTPCSAPAPPAPAWGPAAAAQLATRPPCAAPGGSSAAAARLGACWGQRVC
jgi:hypothetical protein